MWNDAGWRSWFCFLAHGYFTAFFNDQQPRKPPNARLTCFRLSFLPLLFSLRHYLLRKEALRKLRRCRGDCDATWCWLYTLQLHFSFPNPVHTANKYHGGFRGHPWLEQLPHEQF
jgi:hypothetical protein